MRKVLLIQLLFVFLLNFCGNNSWAIGNDGNFWEVLDETAKVGYVIGYSDGFDSAYRKYKEIDKIIGNNPEYSQCYDNPITQAVRQGFKNVANLHVLTKSDTRQAIEGLDKFYTDYANEKIPISIALIVVLKRIKGYPETDNEAIEGIRKLMSEIETE